MTRLLRFSLPLALLLLTSVAHADVSLLVHDLAHAAGGGMVATASERTK